MSDNRDKYTPFVPVAAIDDPVNHPRHYTFGTIEVITVIDDWALGFCEGNVIKYVGRAKHKGHELEDLKKARWYLDHAIEKLERGATG